MKCSHVHVDEFAGPRSSVAAPDPSGATAQPGGVVWIRPTPGNGALQPTPASSKRHPLGLPAQAVAGQDAVHDRGRHDGRTRRPPGCHTSAREEWHALHARERWRSDSCSTALCQQCGVHRSVDVRFNRPPLSPPCPSRPVWMPWRVQGAQR
jgi:hypothetical protein